MRNTKPISKDRIAQIRILRDSGMPVDVVAKECGVARSTVSYWTNPDYRKRRKEYYKRRYNIMNKATKTYRKRRKHYNKYFKTNKTDVNIKFAEMLIKINIIISLVVLFILLRII